MSQLDFETFRSQALSNGFDEVLERRWDPNVMVDRHSHPFALKAVVVQGEMWLTVGASTRHLVPGDEFELDRNELHSEKYGEEGATYWVARRGGAPVSAAAN